MRSTKELLQILLDHIEELLYLGGNLGLCDLTGALGSRNIISTEESFHLWGYIQTHRPINLHYIMSAFHDDQYFWKAGRIKPRIKWLKQQIKKL